MKKLNPEILELISRRLKAMSEPIRLKILQCLRDGERSVGDVAARLDLKHGTASANLVAMQKAGLVVSRREGNRVIYRIGSDLVFKICDSVCAALKTELSSLSRLKKSLS